MYVFPEINPDGRTLGNSYLNIAGVNLFNIKKISKILHAELYYLIKILNKISKDSTIELILHFTDDWK